jgi:hypothetical protein
MEVVRPLGCLKFVVTWVLYRCWLTTDRQVCIVDLNLGVGLMRLFLALRLHSALRCGVLMATCCRRCGHCELAKKALFRRAALLLVAAIALLGVLTMTQLIL